MELKDTVCDLEYAEKFHELGVKKNSVFCIFKEEDYDKSAVGLSTTKTNLKGERRFGVGKDDYFEWIYETYTVAELGEMLPWNGFDYEIICFDKFDDTHQAEWVCGDRGQKRVQFHDKKEANSRAQLLIWLIENNHVNVEELNK